MEGVSAACRSLCEFVATRNSSSAVENGVQVGEATSSVFNTDADLARTNNFRIYDRHCRAVGSNTPLKIETSKPRYLALGRFHNEVSRDGRRAFDENGPRRNDG